MNCLAFARLLRATLEEVTEAEALLHLVDLSHEAWQSQIRSVMSILGEMPCETRTHLWWRFK
jgi:50S ribosomal subunit-associated GTPase HflX